MTTTYNKEIVPPAEYEVKSKEIDRLWNLFSKTGQDLDKVILEARIILENSGYSRTEAMKKIADDHKHLRGFSLANLYRMLPKEDKQYQASKIRIGDREQEKDSHFENDLELQTSDQKRYGLNNEVGQEEKEDTYKNVDVSNGTYESINATTTESDTKNAETNYFSF